MIQQSSAVPYRWRFGRPHYLLITSRHGNWIFPKGIIDPGETAEETAVKETFEEAGVRGQIVAPLLVTYSYEKWLSTCEVGVYLLAVSEETDIWPESAERSRAWFGYEEARIRLMKKKRLQRVLEMAQSRLLLSARRPEESSEPET